MRVKMILPALTEAKSPFFRPIKYSLFPPLGLATLAGYLDEADEVSLQDEHVERLDLDDEPELVVIQVYITSAYRAYQIADRYRRQGAYVVLGGLHATSLPEEAAQHADTVCLGPGEDIWPAFLADYRAGRPAPVYRSSVRTLAQLPPIRRDLIKRHLYLVPNSIVVSRGCPHVCDFCYKEAFFQGGKGFYTQTVDAALAEIERLPGRHLYFLDDHLFGNVPFAAALFDGMRGMNRLWQAAGTVASVLRPGLLEKARECGLRSLFVGFETLSAENLREQHKPQNLKRDYGAAIRRLHDLGIMVNGSFVFGMDDDDPTVFERTVEWAIQQGIETATFHILTPYPGTALHDRMRQAGRLLHSNWDLYDTRHVVYRPARLSAEQLEAGYWWAYREFYRWSSIWRGAAGKPSLMEAARHVAYAGGWKKLEPLWDLVIRARHIARLRPMLEAVLTGFGRHRAAGSATNGADFATISNRLSPTPKLFRLYWVDGSEFARVTTTRSSIMSVTTTVEIHPNVLSTAAVIGDSVVNRAGETLGKIEELMLDLEKGRVAYAVLSFRSSLGMGEKLFATPFEALKLDASREHFTLDIDQNKLKNAPGFDKNHPPQASDRTWGAEVYKFYGIKPYWQ